MDGVQPSLDYRATMRRQITLVPRTSWFFIDLGRVKG